ncbi:Phosphate ABC transporter, periplasmic phosphate-binding protein PstS [Candidatus Terasakiella magnetica]|uniref:Phosphate ABC transporter, periplasmic phosphate-binding protein PstS n=1 Tax=Candidatus Terasakiella magnetica TaxID=1867952 RepID=A0A1C3RIW2_9PROT|nr:substrate-binding domain-containing protein [Candidatus Terasakiella magnetica]SCA57195.1 Phosphate ABC transporter, periplasmic phosphate-binding protein PstS [Candidatus Terasakiella magnetica]
MMRSLFLIAATVLSFQTGGLALANSEFRDSIRIVGSSTVFPFSAFVAEKFHRKTGQASPVVESTGSGGGIKMFCSGIGVNSPDIVTASRRMKVTEIHKCQDNKVKDISEVMIGWDGIMMAMARGSLGFNLTREQLWKALAKRLPIDGQWVLNPHTKWSHIDSSLPDKTIQVFGPPPTSGTRDVFVEEVMIKGCQSAAHQDLKDTSKQMHLCGEMREDGIYVEAGEDDDLIVRRLKNNPNALGVLGYNALERRNGLIESLSVEGVKPDFDSILDGSYPLSRPLFLYVKNEHINALPQISDYVDEFMSMGAVGNEGYLVEKGLIPIQDEQGNALKSRALKLSVD